MARSDNTILYLVGGGALLFVLWKSGIFKTLSNVGEGVGDAVGGVGGAVGDIAGDISGATDNILSLLNPLGALGVNVEKNIEQTGDINRNLKQQVADLSTPQIAAEIAERKVDRQEFLTNAQDSLLTASTYNPLSVLSNFVKNISKPKEQLYTGSGNPSYSIKTPVNISSFPTYNPPAVLTKSTTLKSSGVSIGGVSIPTYSPTAAPQSVNIATLNPKLIGSVGLSAPKTSGLKKLWDRIF